MITLPNTCTLPRVPPRSVLLHACNVCTDDGPLHAQRYKALCMGAPLVEGAMVSVSLPRRSYVRMTHHEHTHHDTHTQTRSRISLTRTNSHPLTLTTARKQAPRDQNHHVFRGTTVVPVRRVCRAVSLVLARQEGSVIRCCKCSNVARVRAR